MRGRARPFVKRAPGCLLIQRAELVERAELLLRAELLFLPAPVRRAEPEPVVWAELVWPERWVPLRLDFCDVWRTWLNRSSGRSEARVLASSTTPFA
jgi:hypothetical protein